MLTFKTISVFAAIFLAFESPSFGQGPPQKIALLVGVSDYFDKNMDDLSFAAKDVGDVGKQLEEFGFEVTKLADAKADRSSIEAALDKFLERSSKLGSDSIVFVMFSGHGQQLPAKTTSSGTVEVPFFCPQDAVPFNARRHSLRGKTTEQIAQEFNLVSLNRVIEGLDERSNSLQNLLVVDACRNNPAKGKSAGITGAGARSIPRGVSILFAARAGQKSWESTDDQIRQGVMTHYLLQGLQGQARNSREQITWSRLIGYIREEVENEGWKIAGGEDRIQNPHAILNFDRSVILDSPKQQRLLRDLVNLRQQRAIRERIHVLARNAERSSARAAYQATKRMNVQPGDWPMWGGWPGRNNTPIAFDLPNDWQVPEFDRKSGNVLQPGENVRWHVDLSRRYVGAGSPCVANGNVFIGSNNSAGFLKRFPSKTDMGTLLCFDESSGEFQWQYSAPRLKSGQKHDWPGIGINSTPCADGDRLWFVDSRNVVVCLDANGFRDGNNKGPYVGEESTSTDEADVIWKYDLMKELGVSQKYKAACSPVCIDDRIFLITGNGANGSGSIPSPSAPSFVCLDRNTGRLIWSDNSPGENILHAQWSSPAMIDVPGKMKQVLFPGGDGWLYSFTVDGHLIWKFDTNPKQSSWKSGEGDRNSLVAVPIVYDGKVYIAGGYSPEFGEGSGNLWCLDPNRRGDVSAELAMRINGGERVPIAHKRFQAVDPSKGELAIQNPNSAVIWHYDGSDRNSDGKIEFEEEFHRMLGAVVGYRGLLFATNFSGLVHCLDSKTGQAFGTYDLFSQTWSSPLIAEGKLFVADEDGKIAVFDLDAISSEIERTGGLKVLEPLKRIDCKGSIYSPPVAVRDSLFISTKDRLYCIGKPQ